MTKIIFGDPKNNKELLGIKLMDMHVHSTLSDGRMTPEGIIRRARELNIGACVTDHDEIKGSLAACKEILSIPSAEITSLDKHDILVYFNSEKDAAEFFKKNIYGKRIIDKPINLWRINLSSSELIEKLDKYNCLVALPHPFTAGPKKSYPYFSSEENKKFLKKIDAIEGVNGFIDKSRNKKAILWAEELKKPIIGGSDSHKISTLGNIMTGCFAETRTEFIEQLRVGNNYVIVKKETSFHERFIDIFRVLKDNIKK